MPTDSPEGRSERRYIIGIGVAEYDDATLNLPAARGDVESITQWFESSRLAHVPALPELANSPTVEEIRKKLRSWLQERRPDDVVVIYLAAHGEVEGGVAYVQGRDSPRQGLAGAALEGTTLGSIIGQAQPHNILLIVDACVAGRLGSAIQRAAEDVADQQATRDPHRQWAQAVLCSTFARDPAHDGRFAKAFIDTVSQERWTGTSRPWIDIDLLMTGLNHELKVLGVPQVAERKVWGPGAAELIPNPNFATRRWGALIADEELMSHFDPASRGVAAGEAGWYFTGRRRELAKMVKWLAKGDSGGRPYVVTGSPGSGKSALVSRLVILSDKELRERVPDLDDLPRETVPKVDSINAVVWCHNKNADQIVADLGNRLGLGARTSDELLAALDAEPRQLSIVVDALDEAAEAEAPRIAANLIRPLAARAGVKVLVATRRHPVRTKEGAAGSDLLAALGVGAKDSNLLVLDNARDRVRDMRAYVAARLMATAEPGRTTPTPYSNDPELAERLAERIAAAADTSFLVAAVTARSLALEERAIDPATEKLWLPTSAGAALASYIDRLPDPGAAVDVLRPLAWAEGAGLPWGPLWAPLAGALARAAAPGEPAVRYDDDTVAKVLDSATDLVVESLEAGEPVYRLFHEALAEHLRRDLQPAVAHAAIAAEIDGMITDAAYESAHPYSLAHLPAHLARSPEHYRRLYELATDPRWERAKRLRFGHSMGFLRDVELAIEGARRQQPEDITSLAGACTVYGRMMAVAPAIVIGVIARAGQLQRAELMANNVEFAVDRCLAYTLLAPPFAADGDLTATQRCLTEAERAISAIDTTHSSMAWAWVTSAARDCGLRDAAMRAADNAAKTIELLRDRQDQWELSNAIFWAAKAARAADNDQARRTLLETFIEKVGLPARNQDLQAASVLRAKELLREVWQAKMEDIAGDRHTIVREGNLALALADAGMKEELDELIAAVVAAGGPRGEDDAQKRYAWALAIAGDFTAALAHVLTIDDLEHRTLALGHVVTIAVAWKEDIARKEDDAPKENDARKEDDARKADDALVTAREIAKDLKKLARSSDWRVQAQLAPILFTLNERQEAMRLAEDLVRQEIVPAQENTVAFPKPDTPPTPPSGARQRVIAMSRRMGKTGRRPLHTKIGALSDAEAVPAIAALVNEGKRDEALRRLADIRIPRLRWEALRFIAASSSDAAMAAAFWRDALLEARLVSEPSVRETLAEWMKHLPDTAEDNALRDRVLDEVRRINVKWIEAGFAEQYESLRASLRSGGERTRLLEDLMVLKTRRAPRQTIPTIDLGWWDGPRVKELVESGGAGQRAFALALMESEPKLADLDLALDLVASSLSAFEQYHALKVAHQLVKTSTAKQRRRLLRVLATERGRHVKPGTDREALARQIERAVARLDAATDA